ncbi:MAG: T9SS type B sorting domain-containing protein, partial [Sphingobacteriales bacterium]
SRYVVATHNDWDAGALQIGPDRKIYFTQWEAPGLSVITDPNLSGSACNFLYNSLLFPSAAAMTYGLPNFIAGDLDSLYTPYNFSWKLLACNSFDIQFTLNRTAGIDSVKWSMGDGNSYTIFNPQHTYQQAGTYLVTMEIFKQDCGAASERITQTITVGRSLIGNSFLPADVSYCGTVNYKIIPIITSDNYLWSTGATSNSITVQSPGSYWLQVTKDGCDYRDTINVLLNAAVQVSLAGDTTVCVNKPIQLLAAVTGAATYLWSNGSTASNIEISMPATYWVQVKNAAGCMASDTLKATWGDCDIYIPSAFTPNGDGINENFGLVTGISSTIFTFYIYNRYGELVFTTTDAFKKWDGKVKGKPSPNGIYVWMMTYKNKAGFIQTDKGTVNLIR